MRTLSNLVVVTLILVAACGKSDKSGASGKAASCSMESMHSCVEYRDGNLALGTESLEKLCSAALSSAKFATTACPADHVIASCKRAEGKDIYYEGYDMQTVDKIQKSCADAGGTFAK